MKVFNLTDQIVDYRGKVIPPYGSEEYDITFIPDRDRALEKNGILSFGALPKWWRKPEQHSPVNTEPSNQMEVSKEIHSSTQETNEEVKEARLEVIDEVKVVEKSSISNDEKSAYKKKRF